MPIPASVTDVVSIDSIITAAYDGISGPAGQKRDWDRERSLYFPGARLIPTAKAGGDGDLAPQILDIDGFIARVEPYFEKSGFYEKEIARRTEQFGRLAQVWSTYESRHDPADPEPFMRGINSIQLFNDGNRWWIVNIYWQQESDEDPIPEKYLVMTPACSARRSIAGRNDPPAPRAMAWQTSDEMGTVGKRSVVCGSRSFTDCRFWSG